MRKNMMANRRRRKRTIGMLTSGLKSVVKWKIIVSSIMLLLLSGTSHVLAVRKGRLMSPSTFTALSGDLHVQIQFNGKDEDDMPYRTTAQPDEHLSQDSTGHKNSIMSTLVISKIIDDVATPEQGQGKDLIEGSSSNGSQVVLQRRRKEVVQNIPLFPDPRFNVTQVTVPCQTFLKGGRYEMQVVSNLKTITPDPLGTNQSEIRTTTLVPAQDERLLQTLDVRWPSAEMIVSPVRLRTYPRSPVEVTLRFPEVNCNQTGSLALPEFWLELIYCGKERSCARNVSLANVLFAEQIRGFPKNKTLHLGCQLFGLAGNYAVQLRPMIPVQNVPTTRRLLSVDWSDEFVFNVYARSIFPCDPHTGIGVLYEYPGCILEQGDRVRLYARQRADVASLKPPTTLHYIAEQRVVKSQHSLHFSCDLFYEKYVEYCFVYVSQSISGAVADVRMDCVPTLPVSESDTGDWGPWSEWTPCSTNCLGGTRNRYRFCDSPPPRYGAKFCEGPSVETEKCGKSIADTWDCIYETSGTSMAKANSTEVSQEIGPGCRCGCIVHLGASKPKRIIAGATQSCPGRSFWLIQVDGEESIALTLSFLRLPCATQYIKVRDGPSLSSTLLVELNGGGLVLKGATGEGGIPVSVESTGGQLLVEFYAGDSQAGNTSSSAVQDAQCTGGFMANVHQLLANISGNNTTPTLVAATRISGKSRTNSQKAFSRLRFTLVHLSAMIFASIIIVISALLGAQYVVRYRKYHLAVARRQDEGSRLHTPRASLTSLQGPPSRAMSTTTLLSEVIYLVKMRPKHHLRHSILRESVDAENLTSETEFKDTDPQAMLAKCDEMKELGSSASMLTLQNERSSPDRLSLGAGSVIGSPSSAEAELAGVHSPAEESKDSGAMEPASGKDSARDSESIISSGMSSLCNSPPMNSKRLSKYSDRYDAATLKLLSSRLDESLQDASSLHSVTESLRLGGRLGSRSVSSSLTNGCYSPAASVVSTATIRTTSNPKESKEKQNRKKLLARPGSEFSLGNQEELEMDYYDYNVINAGSAPGSYLGMDPAYLVWIPPFEEVAEREEDDKTPEPEPEPDPERDERQPLYEEIKLPKYGHYLSPASNTESSKSTTADNTPSSEERSPPNSGRPSKTTSPCEGGKSLPHKQPTPYMSRKQRRQSKQQIQSALSLSSNSLEHEQRSGRSSKTPTELAAVHQKLEAEEEPNESMTGSYVEKETAVEKSSGDLQEFLALDDIQFADESGSDYEAVNLKKTNKTESSLNQDEVRTKLLGRREPKSREVSV
ncbi:hypothetical protein KR026_000721 [Drosophila bipectinata]|nr:hypothetical protein KR026_000721 [Drosophila bipectinata]